MVNIVDLGNVNIHVNSISLEACNVNIHVNSISLEAMSTFMLIAYHLTECVIHFSIA